MESVVDLTDKRVIVTGGTTGIGHAVAGQAAELGALVVLINVDETGCADTIARTRKAGSEALFLSADVADEQQVDVAFKQAVKWLKGLDAVVHLAGVLDGASTPLQEFPVEVWDRIIAVNLRGSFLVARAAVRAMTDKGGVIVLTSSGAGVLGGSSSFAYGASKGGVHGLTLVLQGRLDPRKIRVVDILPGQIATPLKIAQVKRSHSMEKQKGSLDSKLAALEDPEEVAKVFVWAISDSASGVRGHIRTI